MTTRPPVAMIEGLNEAIADAVDDAMAGAGGVTSVNGRSGAVTGLAEAGDLGSAAALDAGTAAGNLPVLDEAGKLPTSVLPALAITDTHHVASEPAMLALTAQKGDIAIRTDISRTFVLAADDASILGNWKELLTPTDTVLSVAGLTAAILAAEDTAALAAIDIEDGWPG